MISRQRHQQLVKRAILNFPDEHGSLEQCELELEWFTDETLLTACEENSAVSIF